jgi:NADPH2:quinone reductase
MNVVGVDAGGAFLGPGEVAVGGATPSQSIRRRKSRTLPPRRRNGLFRAARHGRGTEQPTETIMRAVVVTAPGIGDNIIVSETADPTPSPGEILVEVAYAGCNYADIQIAKGVYPHPKGYPLTGGLEFSGRVAALGEGVTGLDVGDRVAAICENGGAFAELCVVPVERAVKLPEGVSSQTGAAIMIQAFTAWHMLHNVSKTQSGDILLVHAIGGGVGLFLTQLAVKAGATVIGTVGTRGKETRPLALGAALVINREDGDFVDKTLAFTHGREVDKVLDSTGGLILDRSFDVVRKLGHVVSIGEASGRPLPNLWERLVRKSLTFTRMHLGHVDFHGDLWRQSVEQIFRDVQNGSLDVHIHDIFLFDSAAKMLQCLESRQVSGKLLLEINPSL